LISVHKAFELGSDGSAPDCLVSRIGSGTTGVAAVKLGRRFIGFEKVPETARKAEARINRTSRS
jgi:hypothetical protein